MSERPGPLGAAAPGTPGGRKLEQGVLVRPTVVALDAVANWLDLSIVAPIAVSVLTASMAMLSSHLFPAWLCWLGVGAGAGGCMYGVIAGGAFQAGGSLYQTADIASAVVVLGSWVWMLVTAALLFRASAGRRSLTRPGEARRTARANVNRLAHVGAL